MAWAAVRTGRPELVVTNHTNRAVTCRVVAYEKDKVHGNYAGIAVTAAANTTARRRFVSFDDRGALCYFPDDYKNHPFKRPHADSANIAGNLYARTERFPNNVGDGRIIIHCRGSVPSCTVTGERP